jgi:hypothetical protein
MFIDACAYIPMFILLTAYSTAGQKLRVQRSNSWRMRHGAAIVDDLFGIRPVVPTSHCPNADVGILDGQQRNVVIVNVITPVPPRNVVEILLDEVAQPL